ncbi:hypothetical protein IJH16_00105 [Candidatus Saccharibacteria bacterium]|nr:hypothetical protein [Candidatus Saccharibacteria bacterium]
MEDFFKVKDDELSKGRVTLRDLMKSRGWTNAKYSMTDESCIIANRPDGKEVRLCYGTPPTMSYGAGRVADDKYVTYCLLQDLDSVKQPQTILLRTNKTPEVELEKQLKKLLVSHSEIVIKPFDGAHGLDVFVGIKDLDSAKSALRTIKEHAWTGLVLAQEMLHVDQPEVRVICIDYKFVAAYARIPAHVTGDGEHTVLELIDIENSTIRTAPYQSNLSYINRSAALDYLEKQNPSLENYIPKSGEKVQVVGVCNTGQGGTMEDITAAFPEHLRRQAEDIVKKMQLPLGGVDYMGDYVIEVNKAPALYHPVAGPASIICVQKFVEYLEKIKLD